MLFGFRKQHPALQTGEQQNLFADDNAFAFIRTQDIHNGCSGADQGGKLERFLIVINNSDHTRQLSINTQETAAEGCVQFVSALSGSSNNSDTGPSVDGTTLHVLVGPHGFGLYQLR
jgi:neopullulanase